MRERLLEATVDCLAEAGYAGTTTTEVVRRAGVSRGAQLHHFPTKNELVVAATEHVATLRQQEFRVAFAALAPAERTLATALDLIWSMYQGRAFAAWLELAVAARADADLHARFAEMERRYTEHVEAIFREFFPSSPDASFSRTAVDFAFTVINGLALRHAAGLDADADAERVLDLLKTLATVFSPSIGGQP